MPSVALDQLSFDDSFVRSLPADPNTATTSRQVEGACYSLVTPTPVRAPTLLAWSDEAAALLGVARPAADQGALVDVLGGNRVLSGMRPFAACYGGHQFGNWAGQLGDGRAISLGELLGPDQQRWEVQLKGAGPTPYSRRSDGRAVLRSSIREFLCSEAMHHLGIPTTRALCLVGTGDPVLRDMFYDGRARQEPGAIVTRLSPSFVRFGNFEILASRGDHVLLKKLVDYVVTTHYPALGAPNAETYGRWFQEICRRTALMIAHWMRVGFVHGVMNTDNMSILGLTLDYGPYGFLDPYEPGFTPNTTDAAGRRYCYGNQPGIGQWNLLQLARALLPLLGEPSALEAGLELYRTTFDQAHRQMWLDKLGLVPGDDHDEDNFLIEELLACLSLAEVDFTLFFRRLSRLPCEERTERDGEALFAVLKDAFYAEHLLTGDQRTRFQAWLLRYATRASVHDDTTRREQMNRVNPYLIPRNYLVQNVIDKAEGGDASGISQLLDALRHPYEERPEHATLAEKRPEWARNAPGCSALSCSS